MNKVYVKDEYRTNPLSTQPGGSTVSVTYRGGSVRVYDKVKNPRAYIERLDGYKDIVKVEVDGKEINFK